MDWLTIKEAANHLKLGIDKVYKMVQSGELPGARLGGQWRCSKEILDLWALSKTNLSSIKPNINHYRSSKFEGFKTCEMVLRDSDLAPFISETQVARELGELEDLGRELTDLWAKDDPKMVTERTEEKIEILKRLQHAFHLLSKRTSKDRL